MTKSAMVTRKENKGLDWDGGDLGKLSKDKQVKGLKVQQAKVINLSDW